MIRQQAAGAVAAGVQHMSWADVGGLAVLLGFIAFLCWVGSRD